MKIGNMDECILCGKSFRHRRICSEWLDDEKTIKEVKIISSHVECRSLVKKKKMLEEQLLNIERQLLDIQFEIFMKVNV